MNFLEKCSLLVDRLGRTSECYIEVERKGGGGGPGPPFCYAPAHTNNATFLLISYSQ